MSGWVNYDSVISQLEAAGMVLDRDVVPNNTWQKWKVAGEDSERRGRSILKEWTSSKGNTFIVGLAGIWHGNAFDKIKIEIPKQIGDHDMDAEDHKAMAAARKAMLKEAEANNKAQAKRAAEWAGMVWAGCQPATDHPYLSRKQIQPHTARVLGAVDIDRLPHLDQDNAERLKRAGACLVIPMHDTSGNIQGLQFVGDKGKTFWPTGMAMASTFGLLGHFPRSGTLLLTEGFATAASLHESTGLPCAYAFSAGNLEKAAKEIRKAAPNLRLLIAADDDYLTQGNPGCAAAAKASAEVSHCDWIKPDFTGPDGTDLRVGKKLTDFNDLAILAGVPLTLANQINSKLDALGWRDGSRVSAGAGPLPQGGGDGGSVRMKSQLTIDEAVMRFCGIYGLGGKVMFDFEERRVIHRDDVMNILPPRAWDMLKTHALWRVVRDYEIGFDPSQADKGIVCNTYNPDLIVQPQPGQCEELLGLLDHMCSHEDNADEIRHFILSWMAIQVQQPGVKLHTAIVVHGKQGSGKNLLFESFSKIFGPYGTVVGQYTLEDKFNDWAENKQVVIGDEVLARADMFHQKNRLKSMVTSDTIWINPKGLPTRMEKNRMNIVFLSNERQPLALEDDDRRHLVLWINSVLSKEYYEGVAKELATGGIAAFHQFLLEYDLKDFKPWTKPPMTRSKNDLVHLGKSSEERFIQEWIRMELDSPNGHPMPFCPCLGSHLYRVYEVWCEKNGERKRSMKEIISFAGKRQGWTVGESKATYQTIGSATIKKRKMVIPSAADFAEALKRCNEAHESKNELVRPKPDAESQQEWLTDGYFTFANAAGIEP